MDRGAWWTTVRGVSKVGHHRATNTFTFSLSVQACSVTSVMPSSSRTYGLQPIKLLNPWDSRHPGIELRFPASSVSQAESIPLSYQSSPSAYLLST